MPKFRRFGRGLPCDGLDNDGSGDADYPADVDGCSSPGDDAEFDLRRDTGRAMSQENVETVRRWSDAFNDRDWDTFAALMDAKIVYDASLIDSEVIHGRDAVVSFLRVEKELWSAIRYEIIEATDLSEDGVVLRVNVAARGRGSGAKIRGGALGGDESSRRLHHPVRLPGHTRRSPRSRRAVGVGDVAGERRARAPNL
jgi:hypothetical protein